jgi:hypothetical protein
VHPGRVSVLGTFRRLLRSYGRSCKLVWRQHSLPTLRSRIQRRCCTPCCLRGPLSHIRSEFERFGRVDQASGVVGRALHALLVMGTKIYLSYPDWRVCRAIRRINIRFFPRTLHSRQLRLDQTKPWHFERLRIQLVRPTLVSDHVAPGWKEEGH